METTYYDYDSQEWKHDLEGFVAFHIDQLDFLTENEDLAKSTIAHIKHHATMLKQAGKDCELSDYVRELITNA